MKNIKVILSAIDSINDWVGKSLAYVMFPMVVIVLIETVGRTFFNYPTVWAHETSTFILAGYTLLGGGYVLLHRGHVNVDIIYMRLSPRKRAMLDIVTAFIFFFLCIAVIWKGAEHGLFAMEMGERTNTAWEPIVWPIRLAVPVGASLLLLQGIADCTRNLILAVSNKQEL